MLWISLLVLVFQLSLALCAEDFYKLLDIDKSASDRDIKKSYRTLSKKYHPDKNPGDESAHKKFVAIAEAYDVLSNEETRRIYDQYGHDGLDQHKQGGGQRAHDPFDLFSRFFGGGGHFGGGGQRRGPDMELQVKIPLRDFYNGNEHEFSVEKQQICEDCEGSGSADGHVETCTQCNGQGVILRKHMLAPGIFQNIQMACDKCSGKGKTIKKPCKVCGGSRVVRKVSTHSLYIAKGMARGESVIYENEADASPDWVAGDLVVHLEEAEPVLGSSDEERTDGTFFRRKEKNLFWKEVLSLREAWMGDWTRNLTHLDGHIVQLSRKRGETVQPNLVEIIKGEGMPLTNQERDHSNDEFGDLHVEYLIVLPDQMDKSMEKDFWAVWEKWRKKKGVDLGRDSGRPIKDEL